MTSSGLEMIGSYDPFLVILSVLIAILASYTALDLAGRVTASRGWARLWWLTGGAVSMGIGIWSMHYTAMLAFSLPVPVQYHWPTALLSLLAGIFYSAVTLFVVSRRVMGLLRASTGGIFMGGGIVTMHYTAIESMRMAGICRYSPALVTLSFVLAVASSLLSLWLAFHFRDEVPGRRVRKAASVLLMGAAIVGMHYTAMAAASFTRTAMVPDLTHAVRLATFRPEPGAITGIGTVSVIILVLTLATSLVDRLQKERTLLDELFEQTPQAVALMNGDRRLVRVNREFTRIFGYTPQETVGRRLSELIVPGESQDEGFRHWDLAMRGQRVDVETVRQRKDGSRLHVSLVLVPFLAPGGERETYTIYRDITERKRAEEALRASEERWRSIFENSAVGISLTGPSGVFTATNRAYQQMLGYTEEELRALSFMDITYEEDREVNWALSRELWEGKRRQFQCEKRYRRKDGKLIWARITVSLAPGTEAVSQFSMAIVEEITERKRAEEELRRSEDRLRLSIDTIPTMVWTLRDDGALDFLNKRWRDYTGVSLEEGIEKPTGVMHPEELPDVMEKWRAGMAAGEPFEHEMRLRRADGAYRWFLVRTVPLRDESGNIVKWFGTSTEIEDRKQAEDALQRSFDELRALAARLQSAREEERTRVAREIHDELGQALTAIKIDLAALIRDLPGDSRPQIHRSQSILKLLDEAIQSVRRIATELRPGILDDLGLVAAVEWAAEEFQARTGTQCPVSLPGVDIALDPERATALFRILQETLTNVARHTNATRVEVRLTQENEDLILQVHDNGQGIDEEHLSGSRSLGILGMRERALLLGGELTISGAPRKGTVVRVRIPQPNPKQPEPGK
jgi:PAS domain S-box-containing protein